MRIKIISIFSITIFCFIRIQSVSAQSFNGYALYNEMNSNTAYLIDKDQNIGHSWSCSVACNYTVMLKENGNIVRGGTYSGNQLNGAAIGGIVQEIDPSGTVVWEYVYSNNDYCSHHDFCILPNGNVILTAWEVKTSAELLQAGFDGANSDKWPTHFVELEPDGSGSASIVWEWHMWDHMIQDFDAGKDNYGVVESNPQLMNINAVSGGFGGPGGPGGPGGGDWYHVNGIDYNPSLDQLVFSSRYASEIYIIDHSTTSAEAASHTGGNSGMGGDFLYRWGNPANYGSTGVQTIPAAVHDPRWIKDDGRPNGGYIQFFNNEGGSGNTSVVDAIQAPESGWIYTMGGISYGPANYDWRHDCLANSTGQSASDRMSNGNTFVNVSMQYMYEVDASNNLIWQYNASPAKAFRYECDHPGISALLGAVPCALSINEESISQVEYYPNPSTGKFKLDGIVLGENNLVVSVVDLFGNVVLETENSLTLDLSSLTNGVYFAKLNFDNKNLTSLKLMVAK